MNNESTKQELESEDDDEGNVNVMDEINMRENDAEDKRIKGHALLVGEIGSVLARGRTRPEVDDGDVKL